MPGSVAGLWGDCSAYRLGGRLRGGEVLFQRAGGDETDIHVVQRIQEPLQPRRFAGRWEPSVTYHGELRELPDLGSWMARQSACPANTMSVANPTWSRLPRQFRPNCFTTGH